jgi:hypothetical protein
VAKKQPAASLADEVLSVVVNRKSGYPCWCDRLPEPYRQQFEDVRDRYDPQKHQKSAYARAIIAVATKHGLKPPTEQQVIKWLRLKHN